MNTGFFVSAAIAAVAAVATPSACGSGHPTPHASTIAGDITSTCDTSSIGPKVSLITVKMLSGGNVNYKVTRLTVTGHVPEGASKTKPWRHVFHTSFLLRAGHATAEALPAKGAFVLDCSLTGIKKHAVK